jgi:hypothetical protein
VLNYSLGLFTGAYLHRSIHGGWRTSAKKSV